jgi:hypothetical protein
MSNVAIIIASLVFFGFFGIFSVTLSSLHFLVATTFGSSYKI